jgi:hypothetical protein
MFQPRELNAFSSDAIYSFIFWIKPHHSIHYGFNFCYNYPNFVNGESCSETVVIGGIAILLTTGAMFAEIWVMMTNVEVVRIFKCKILDPRV